MVLGTVGGAAQEVHADSVAAVGAVVPSAVEAAAEAPAVVRVVPAAPVAQGALVEISVAVAMALAR